MSGFGIIVSYKSLSFIYNIKLDALSNPGWNSMYSENNEHGLNRHIFKYP